MLSELGERGLDIDRRTFIAAVASSVATSAMVDSTRVAAASGPGWPTYGYDEIKSRNNPDGERLPDELSDVGELWVSDGSSVSDAVAADGTVYAGFENGDVRALDSDTGDEVWSFSTEYSQRVSNPPAVSDGSVYVGGDRGAFYSLDAATGEVEWEKDLDDEVTSPPTIAGSSVYFGGLDGLYELSLDSGERKSKEGTSSPVSVSPVITEEMVFVGSGSDLYALDRFTGVREWRENVGGSLREMVVDDSRIYFLTNTIRAFFQDTGDKRWGRSLPGSPSGSPAIYDDSMYIGTDIGVVQSLNLNDSGAGEWRLEAGGEIRGSPLVVDGVLYAISAEGPRAETATLHAVDPDTGDMLGESSIDYGVNEGPTVAYGNAYVSTGSGVYGYGRISGPDASFDIEPQNPSVGDEVSFESSSSMGNARISSYEWEFESDSESFEASGTSVERSFESEGEWQITLTVTDRADISDTATEELSVTQVQADGGGQTDGGGTTESGATEEGEDGNSTAESGDEQDGGVLPGSISRALPDGVSDTMAIAAGGVGAVVLGGIGFATYRKMSGRETETREESAGAAQTGSSRGHTEEASAGSTKTCQNCGTELDESIIFCTSCGTEVEENTKGEDLPEDTVAASNEAELEDQRHRRPGEPPERATSGADEGEGAMTDTGASPEGDHRKEAAGTETKTDVKKEEETSREETEVGSTDEGGSDSEPVSGHTSGDTCPECGAEVEKDNMFCISCGASLEESKSGTDKIMCPSCGEEVDKDSKFCISCGTEM